MFFLRRDDKWAVILLLQVLVVYTVRWLSGGRCSFRNDESCFFCVSVFRKKKKKKSEETKLLVFGCRRVRGK